jgi:hypothetical protein
LSASWVTDAPDELRPDAPAVDAPGRVEVAGEVHVHVADHAREVLDAGGAHVLEQLPPLGRVPRPVVVLGGLARRDVERHEHLRVAEHLPGRA